MTDAKNKIIVALDVPTIAEATALIDELSPYVGGFKVGLELINNCGVTDIFEIAKKERLFFDGKFHDIPNTVAGACDAIASHGIWMMNVHTLGGLKMMQASRQATDEAARAKGLTPPRLIGVTILTSLDSDQLSQCGFDVSTPDDMRDQVVKLALLAKEAGLDGVVASPKEIATIRDACGPNFLIVTPGVRPKWATKDDQTRITSPKEAVDNGADYLVIGRPITNPLCDIGTPTDAAKRIGEEIK
jgi:orotidine-5'-phosphate decarboxylase